MEKLDISLYDICEKHAPVKSLKKKTTQSMADIWNYKAYV